MQYAGWLAFIALLLTVSGLWPAAIGMALLVGFMAVLPGLLSKIEAIYYAIRYKDN